MGNANVSGQLQTVNIRQLSVQQSQSQVVESGCLESSLAVERPDAPRPKFTEHMFEGPANVRVVVHDEDGPVDEAHGSSHIDGSPTVKVLPFPISLSTPIEPPC